MNLALANNSKGKKNLSKYIVFGTSQRNPDIFQNRLEKQESENLAGQEKWYSVTSTMYILETKLEQTYVPK